MGSLEQQIFKSRSHTYYWGAMFFPKRVRADVLRLYSFLRVADDYVDVLPPQAEKFRALRAAWQAAQHDDAFDTARLPADTVDARVIKNIVAVARKYQFEPAWIEAFWRAMAADLEGRRYRTLADSLEYVHGSAEVVGLMMFRVLGLPPVAYAAAQMEGRALQWVNFIRDAAEDISLGRCYFPEEDLRACGLPAFTHEAARAHPEAFARLVHLEIARYQDWQSQAAAGLHHIPGRLRPAIQTAGDMYGWTAQRIAADPLVVLEGPVRPGKRRILARGLRNLMRSS
jgi:15-cis-phytoene synthase